MTYNPNIPSAGELISTSQAEIQTNFALIDSNTLGFGVDHFAFSAGANQGKHKKSTYVEQGADPVTAANEIDLYSKDLGTVTQLFLAREAAGGIVQMTAQCAAAPNHNPINTDPGQTFLPGGLILKFGSTGAVADNGVVSFVDAFPSACMGVVLTIIDPNATSRTINVKTGTVNATNFTVRVSTGSVSAFYFAIGR